MADIRPHEPAQAGGLSWRPLRAAELEAVAALAALAHPLLPERPETFAEKRRLWGEGALALKQGRDPSLIGYAFAFPWRLGTVPKLDTLLHALPVAADCLYLHDCVVAANWRGQGAASALIDRLRAIARKRGLAKLALVAVYGSETIWARAGFAAVDWPAARDSLRGYGSGARTMLASL
jgi:GNAT superfamily N-acetyltransferase